VTILGSGGSPQDATGDAEGSGAKPTQEGHPLGQGNVTEVTRDGLRNIVSDRQAQTGAHGGRSRKKKRGDPNAMVPEAEFTSYYGRPIVKAAPWTNDIPAYLFMGGLMGGSSLVAAAADLTGRPLTRQAARGTALVALLGSGYALVHDLGRPERFYNMLRIARLTSPMSMGTWILTAYGPFCGAAAATELVPFVPGLPAWVHRIAPPAGRVTGLVAAAVAPAVAGYTAVLMADTSTPSWKESWQQLPFVFVSGAAASGAGVALMAPLSESGPARRLAVGAAIAELASTEWMERSMGLAAEPYHQGTAGKIGRAARAFLVTGGVLAAVSRRSRAASVVAGLSLLAGAACTRFAVFEAGQASAKDPKYVVVPQRERLKNGQQASVRPIP
jgi:formate-dependent nitrite reductase membrane component NrfD